MVRSATAAAAAAEMTVARKGQCRGASASAQLRLRPASAVRPITARAPLPPRASAGAAQLLPLQAYVSHALAPQLPHRLPLLARPQQEGRHASPARPTPSAARRIVTRNSGRAWHGARLLLPSQGLAAADPPLQHCLAPASAAVPSEASVVPLDAAMVPLEAAMVAHQASSTTTMAAERRQRIGQSRLTAAIGQTGQTMQMSLISRKTCPSRATARMPRLRGGLLRALPCDGISPGGLAAQETDLPVLESISLSIFLNFLVERTSCIAQRIGMPDTCSYLSGRFRVATLSRYLLPVSEQAVLY